MRQHPTPTGPPQRPQLSGVGIGQRARSGTATARQAVAHAVQAVELAPKAGAFWNTLGTARYRNGQWNEAIERAGEVCGARLGRLVHDWLFLAMAHWQLGHQEEARRQYDKSVEWMEKHKPADEELKRFRAEAAELLGMMKTPAEKSEKEEKTGVHDSN